MDWNSLPLEVWILIWRHLDFETLQKSGTLVSKTWFEGIRSDTILSGELALKLKRKEQLDGEEISDILSKWKMLRVLYVECEDAITQAGIDLTENKFLRKIIVSKTETFQNEDRGTFPLALKDLDDWGWATEIWFDPKQFFSPIKLENIVGLKLFVDETPENFPNDKSGQILTENVEKLTCVDTSRFSGFHKDKELILSFKKLRILEFNDDISSLLDTLDFIEKMQNQITTFFICLWNRHGWDKKKTLDVLKKAKKFMNENFLSVAFETLMIEPNDQHGPNRLDFKIKKSKGYLAKLTSGYGGKEITDSNENSDEDSEEPPNKKRRVDSSAVGM